MLARRKLFRTQALKHYAQNRQKDILPGFVTPPVFLCLWLLLLIISAATFFAWQENIPTYTQAAGVLLVQQDASATALVFVPTSSNAHVTRGQQLTVQVNLTGQQFQTNVISVDPTPVTPQEASTRYALTGDMQFLITQPSLVIHLAFPLSQASQIVDHLSISAQIQVGSRSLLSMLPDLLGNAFKG